MGEGAGQGAGESRFRSASPMGERPTGGDSRFPRREQTSSRPEPKNNVAYTSDLAKIGIEFDMAEPSKPATNPPPAFKPRTAQPSQYPAPVRPQQPMPPRPAAVRPPLQKPFTPATPEARPQPVKTMSLADLKPKDDAAPKQKHVRPDVDIDSLRNAIKGALTKQSNDSKQ